MTNTRSVSMLAFVGVMFLLIAERDASAKEQVERPFKIQGSSTMVVEADGTYDAEGGGVATHCGQFRTVGWGVMGLGGSGVITAANGDEIFFDDAPSGVVTIKNGSGRFEGATGEFTNVIEMVGPPVVDPVTETITMRFIWRGTGEIKY